VYPNKTTTQAYFSNEYNTALKSFIEQALEENDFMTLLPSFGGKRGNIGRNFSGRNFLTDASQNGSYT